MTLYTTAAGSYLIALFLSGPLSVVSSTPETSGVITHEDTPEITITDVPEITIEDRL